MTKNDLEWLARYRKMKKERGFKNKDISDITGLNEMSIKTLTSSSRDVFPRWAKLAVVIHEKSNENLALLNRLKQVTNE